MNFWQKSCNNTAVLLILSTTIGLQLRAQAEHDHTHDFQMPRSMAKVTYTIKADISPNDRIAKGEMEIAYTNVFEDTLKEFYLRMDLNAWQQGSYMDQRLLQVRDSSVFKLSDEDRGYCRIDSIKFMNLAVEPQLLSLDNTVLRIELPQPVLPREKIYFLLNFESKLPKNRDKKANSVVFADWTPRVCLYQEGRWFAQQYLGWHEEPVEVADFNVALSIDSSFTIAHGGKLLNEKSHYGVLQYESSDSILADFTNTNGYDLENERYHPLFENGRKEYFIADKTTPSFTFVVYDDCRRDRVLLNDLTVDLCYVPHKKSPFDDSLVFDIIKLARILNAGIGSSRIKQLTIAQGSFPNFGTATPSIIVVPQKIKNKRQLLAGVAAQMVSNFLPRTLPYPEMKDQFLGDGVAYYYLATVAFANYGAEGYTGLGKYEGFVKGNNFAFDLRDKDSRLLNPFNDTVIYTSDFVKNDIALLQSYPMHVFRDVPAQWQMLRFLVGTENLQKVLSSYFSEYEHRYITREAFHTHFKALLPDDGYRLLTELPADSAYVDCRLQDLSVRQQSEGSTVSYVINYEPPLIFPLEVAFVWSGQDTLYDTVGYFDIVDSVVTLNCEKNVSSPPDAVLIDPHHLVRETDWHDNHYFRMATRNRYEEPADLFLGYRKF